MRHGWSNKSSHQPIGKAPRGKKSRQQGGTQKPQQGEQKPPKKAGWKRLHTGGKCPIVNRPPVKAERIITHPSRKVGKKIRSLCSKDPLLKVQLTLSCDGIRIFHTTVHEQDEMLHNTDGLSGLQQSTSQPVTHTPAALRILVFVIKVAITMQVIGPGGRVNDKIEIGRISLLLQACVGQFNCPLSMSQAYPVAWV